MRLKFVGIKFMVRFFRFFLIGVSALALTACEQNNFSLKNAVTPFLKNSVGENEMLHYQFYPIYTLGHRQISLIQPRLIFQKLQTFALADPMKRCLI